MHAEDEEAKEDRDPNQRDGGRGSEQLAVVDSEVPDHGKQHHEHGDHQASCAESQAGRPQPYAEHGASPGSRVLLCGRLTQRLGLRDVTVQHAVMGDVEGQERALGVLQQLALVDELNLMFTAREVLTERKRGREIIEWKTRCFVCAIEQYFY